MAFRMSEQPRTIKIYNLLSGTNEFIGEGDAYIPPHTGLPANSTDIAPPDIPAGFVAITYGIFWINPVYMRTRAKPVISLMLYQYIISLMFRVNTDLPGT